VSVSITLVKAVFISTANWTRFLLTSKQAAACQ